jgi:hypothetical protein
MEVTFGGYALPVVLSVILSLVYKVVPSIPDRWKAPIAVVCGIALGMVGVAYNGKPWTIVNVIDFGLYGLITGAGAVGLYELQRAAIRPRS